MKYHSLKLADFQDVTKVQSKAALKTLTGMLRLFKDGERWIKGVEESNGNYCLVGARRAVDGPGENLAQCIMLQTLSGNQYRVVSEEPVLINDGEKFELHDNNYNLLQEDGFTVIDEYLDEDEETITSFNDHEDIKFSDIRKFLERCIGFTEKLVASK